MKKIINRISPILIAYSFLLLLNLFNNHAYGQKLFTGSSLGVLEDIALAGGSKDVKKMMKNNGWTVEEEKKTDLGGKFILFKKAYWSDVAAIFYKDDRLIVTKAVESIQFLSNDFVRDMKKNGFAKISSITGSNASFNNLEKSKWSKSGYPFQLVADNINGLAELHTSISIGYEK